MARSATTKALLVSSMMLPTVTKAAMSSPPMGWMSWERFRCETNCTAFPDECINEELYRGMGDALVSTGLAEKGYTQVSIDDCWSKGRDGKTNRLLADPDRFPHGIKALADYLHEKGLKLGIYSDAGNLTCGGYVGSRGYEELDAQTFADWGVDYLKLDGCYIDTAEEMVELYTKFGEALQKVSRKIGYSCSWPAYLGDNETQKPYDTMFKAAHCDTWRNWADIDNSAASMVGILNHWAEWTKTLQEVPAPAFNDPDMILAADDHYGKVLSPSLAKTQLTVWSIVKAPLFLAADLRKLAKNVDNLGSNYLPLLKDDTFLGVVQDSGEAIGGCVVGCGGELSSVTKGTGREGAPVESGVGLADVDVGSSALLSKFIPTGFSSSSSAKTAEDIAQEGGKGISSTAVNTRTPVTGKSLSMTAGTKTRIEITGETDHRSNPVLVPAVAPAADVQIWFRRLSDGIALGFVNLNDTCTANVTLDVDPLLLQGMNEAWKFTTASQDLGSGEGDVHVGEPLSSIAVTTDDVEQLASRRTRASNEEVASSSKIASLADRVKVEPSLVRGSRVSSGQRTEPDKVPWSVVLQPTASRLFVKKEGKRTSPIIDMLTRSWSLQKIEKSRSTKNQIMELQLEAKSSDQEEIFYV
ncbi:unnamed protein product [Amoebophrya sp. A25]|nr:unnamed protein product [Amoebophrya sp. A25]|eukprot:GSA25T00019678001.1